MSFTVHRCFFTRFAPRVKSNRIENKTPKHKTAKRNLNVITLEVHSLPIAREAATDKAKREKH